MANPNRALAHVAKHPYELDSWYRDEEQARERLAELRLEAVSCKCTREVEQKAGYHRATKRWRPAVVRWNVWRR